MSFLIRSFKNKWISPPKPTTESYEGRNVIVTGATSGIGPEAVAKFAALGASKVIIAARDLEKGETIKASIEARLQSRGQLEVWELDMNNFDSIVAFAKRANVLDHLDVAVLNAGVHRSSYNQSKHGWEEDLQVNTLSTTLLGILLLPKLKQSKQAGGRIPVLEFVNSGLHQNAIVPPETRKQPNILAFYNKRENFGEGSQYRFTKVFLMYATNQLASEISSGDVIITSICPGMVKTDLGRDHYFPGIWVLAWGFVVLFFRTPPQGADMILSGTTQGEKVHGRFWQHDRIQPVAPSLKGEENQKFGTRVWEEIIGVLRRDVPSVAEALDTIVPRR